MMSERRKRIPEGLFRAATIESSFRASLLVLFLSELIAVIGPLTDSLIISAKLGADGVKEFGIVNPILLAYSCIGSVFAVGSVTLCSRMIGTGQSDEAEDTFSLAFVWVMILSTVGGILLLLLAGPITVLLGASRDSGSLFAESKRYLIGLTVSFPAVNLIPFLSAYMQVDNDRNRVLASTAVLTAANIAGDLIAVSLNAGMLGIGLATSAANYLASIILLFHFRKPGAFFRPRFSRLPFQKTGTLLAGGFSALITFAGNMLMFIILNRLLLRYVPLSDTFNAMVKRLMDIVGSILAIILFSPVMLITAIAIKRSSPGPLIFSQERVGLHNKPFKMFKFRSMRVQTETDEKKGWTTKDDPRVTKVGKVIRKTSIDELPQLFNVLRGDMSMIGPRPERPQYVEKFREEIPRYMVKHQVRPGMTGWAQVNGYRGNTSIRKRIELDIYYIENWSVAFDIKILVLTVFKGFINRNAY